MKIIRAILIALILSVSVSCGGGASGPLPATPSATALRDDLMFGYYGDCDKCIADTGTYVNLVWITGWGALDRTSNVIAHLTEARDAGVANVVLTIPEAYQAAPEMNVRMLFTRLRALGLLSSIRALYPVDEPNLLGYSDELVTSTNTMLRRVMAEFPELASTKLAVIYQDTGQRPGIASYDWAGFDSYDHREQIFADGQYDNFKALLIPSQKILLVSGGVSPWKQDPAAFVAKANADPQVVALIAFIWHWPDGAIVTGPGIESNGMAGVYCAAGMKIKGSLAAC